MSMARPTMTNFLYIRGLEGCIIYDVLSIGHTLNPTTVNPYYYENSCVDIDSDGGPRVDISGKDLTKVDSHLVVGCSPPLGRNASIFSLFCMCTCI